MSLIKCSECGKEVSDKAISCPNCGNPINLNSNSDVVVNNKKGKKVRKKDSTLSIWAFVLSLFAYLSVIGFILALVDLCQNDKEKSHGCSVVAIIFFLIWIFFLS